MKKLLVWVAIGVAVKYFLDSDKGEEFKSYVKDLLGDAQDVFNEYFEKATGKPNDYGQNTIQDFGLAATLNCSSSCESFK